MNFDLSSLSNAHDASMQLLNQHLNNAANAMKDHAESAAVSVKVHTVHEIHQDMATLDSDLEALGFHPDDIKKKINEMVRRKCILTAKAYAVQYDGYPPLLQICAAILAGVLYDAVMTEAGQLGFSLESGTNQWYRLKHINKDMPLDKVNTQFVKQAIKDCGYGKKIIKSIAHQLHVIDDALQRIPKKVEINGKRVEFFDKKHLKEVQKNV